MKIFEYKPKIGGFTIGMEKIGTNEVVEVAGINRTEAYPYNSTHKKWFLPEHSQISEYETKTDYDIAVLHPDVGENLASKGKKKFKTGDLYDCLRFVEYEKPKFAIISTDINTVPLLNRGKNYVRDGFNELSKDIVIQNLQRRGYRAYLIVMDEANYGVPVHREIALYVAVPFDFTLKIPKGQYNKYGKGKYKKFRTVKDAIGDLGEMGEWAPYATEPQNEYQNYLRGNQPHVTWHFVQKKLKKEQFKIIRQVKQGENAGDVKSVNKNNRYKRPKWDEICHSLDHKFTTVSSNRQCIHPLHHRTFTMREGMRIMGLPDSVSFDLKDSQVVIRKMIVNSISPIIGEVIALGLKNGE